MCLHAVMQYSFIYYYKKEKEFRSKYFLFKVFCLFSSKKLYSSRKTLRQKKCINDNKSFFDTWTSMDEITPLFKTLPIYCNTRWNQWWWIELIEFFVMRLYSKTCNTKEVNETRGILFSWYNKVIENIRPTKGALRQHVLWSVLQSSKWQQFLHKDFDGRDAYQWDW